MFLFPTIRNTRFIYTFLLPILQVSISLKSVNPFYWRIVLETEISEVYICCNKVVKLACFQHSQWMELKAHTYLNTRPTLY